jgi:hypothetical protein
MDIDWWFHWNMFYFSIYLECHDPNWRTGVGQPPSSNMFYSNILNTFVDPSHVVNMYKYVTYKSTILRVSMMLSQRMNPRNPNDLPEMAVVSPFPRWNMVKPQVQVVRSCLLKVFSICWPILNTKLTKLSRHNCWWTTSGGKNWSSWTGKYDVWFSEYIPGWWFQTCFMFHNRWE